MMYLCICMYNLQFVIKQIKISQLFILSSSKSTHPILPIINPIIGPSPDPIFPITPTHNGLN